MIWPPKRGIGLMLAIAAIFALHATALAATAGSLTIYSGRQEPLVGPLFAQFEAETGIKVNVRYGDTAELAATILEEGRNSPADIFFAKTPAHLALSRTPTAWSNCRKTFASSSIPDSARRTVIG